MKKIFLIISVALLTFRIASPKQFDKIIAYSKEHLPQVIQEQKPQTSSVEKLSADVKEKAEQQSKTFALQTQQSIQQEVQNIANKVNAALEDKTQEVLGIFFEENIVKPDAELVQTAPDNARIVSIDFLTHKGIRLTFKKNTAYYINITNLLSTHCLFVNEVKYHPKITEYIKLNFSDSGHYNLLFDYCSQDMKKFGEIMVE